MVEAVQVNTLSIQFIEGVAGIGTGVDVARRVDPNWRSAAFGIHNLAGVADASAVVVLNFTFVACPI